MFQEQFCGARFALERPVCEGGYLSFKGMHVNRLAAAFNLHRFFNQAGDIWRFFLALTLLRAVPQIARLELMLRRGLFVANGVIAGGLRLLVFGVSHGKPSGPEAEAATYIRLVP